MESSGLDASGCLAIQITCISGFDPVGIPVSTSNVTAPGTASTVKYNPEDDKSNDRDDLDDSKYEFRLAVTAHSEEVDTDYED